MKRIGKSKKALIHQIPIMAENLSEKSGSSCRVAVECWKHQEDPEIRLKYIISFVPGHKCDCTIISTSDWSDLLEKYSLFMEEGFNAITESE